MSDEGFEEWDADFLDQVIQVEELALSSANPTQHQPLPPLSPSSHFRPPPPQKAVPYDDISYSPPRKLSQRVSDSSADGLGLSSVPTVNNREDEIERLKRELSHVSKQLRHLEQDCLLLRKERDKKEEQLKSVFPHIQAKDAEFEPRKRKNVEYGVQAHETPGEIKGIQNGNPLNYQTGSWANEVALSCKAIGVQTDKFRECAGLSTKDDLLTHQGCRNKLLAVWDLPGGQGLPRNLVSKLLFSCETDFYVLFGCLGLSSKTKTNFLADGRSCLGLQDYAPPAHSAERAKISHLYSLFTQIDTGMVRLEALIEALVDLCSLKNDTVLYRSLRILNKILHHTFGLDMTSCRRDNVIVEGHSSANKTTDIYGSECAGTSLFMHTDGVSDLGLIKYKTRSFNAESLCKNECRNLGSAVPTCIDWVSIFKLMHQIAMTSTKECVRLEAVSTMNIILTRSTTYLNREQFAGGSVFQSISHLLRKQSGLSVQKQAVHLLFLLLNCTKVLVMFCSRCKEEVESAVSANCEVGNAPTGQGFSGILDGLVDCVACDGNGTQEVKLRRSTVTLLAFLASSGKPGFEILLGQRLLKKTNFLSLILQMLISEIDAEVVSSPQPPEIFRERTLLIREALIFLNRLVSNPQYSSLVLRVLTNSRDAACLTVDIANRLSCKGQWLWQSDSIMRQMRESEIVDLARVFKKRVFTFLGESMS
ncbi:hypothetical protein NMG60_11030035 [Bertholletia excelsa]